MKYGILLSFLIFLTGCGHSQINYTPTPPTNMTWDKAVSIVERGFYEDYGEEKTQAVQITEESIILSDGSITTTKGFGTAVPVYGAAIVSTNTTGKTVAAGQRIYLAELQPSVVVKRNGREHRYAVIIRAEPGYTARRVFFRSEDRAKGFADAIAYLHEYAKKKPIANQSASAAQPEGLTKEKWRRQQLEELQQSGVSYEEYQRRYRELMSQ